MIHALTFETAQLDAELRGRTTFRDPRLPSTPASVIGSRTTQRMTPTSLNPDDARTSSSTPRPTHGIAVTTSNRTLSTAEIRATMNRARSRSRPRSNPSRT